MRIALILLLLMLASCRTLPTPPARLAQAESLAAAAGWHRHDLAAGGFRLAAWLPDVMPADDRLTVYIEGDGLAWRSSTQPSDDPTPVNPLALRLALQHPQGAAAYLARACQYGQSGRADCPSAYWTDRRFSEDLLAASDRAVSQLQAMFGARRLVLIGYSGGGAMAALLAARRSDVDRLITVAGNLDHRAWTSLHGLSPLSGSRNPADEVARLKGLRQWHLVGGQDAVMPPTIARGYAERFPEADRPMVKVIDTFDHQCCWAERWPAITQELLGDGRPGN